MRNATIGLAIAAALTFSATGAQAQELIEYEKFTLDNGLSVVVHEDHRTPKVSVGVWYHVGSKDEPQGKSGFAHLFEHLMFNGSENHDKEYFPPLQEIGASEVNGTTWLDRTNYYQTVPTGGLERVLWLESDRMGHLQGAITQDKLDEQRSVVQNEKRTSDNRPYGLKQYHVMEGVFPQEHPYHHSTIGSMEDLDAASLEDVKGWFERYYGAANAVLVMVGDVTPEKARDLAEQYFGHIPAGPPVARLTSWVPVKPVDTTQVMYDSVPQRVVSWNWPAPPSMAGDAAALRAGSQVLGMGKSSRLYQTLVQELELASSASASYQGFEIAGVYSVDVTLKDEADMVEVKEVVNNLLTEFLRNGPTEAELEQVKASYYSNMVRAFEGITIKGFALAQSELFYGDPGAYADDLEQLEAVTAADVVEASKRYLRKGKHELTILPYGDHAANAEDARPQAMPGLLSEAEITVPPVERGVLSNGIEVRVVERQDLPLVEMTMTFDAGSAADQHMKEGLSSFTLGLMDEGTTTYTSKELSDRRDLLGARISGYSNADTTTIALSALTRNLEPSINLWADYIRNPAFRPEDLARDKKLTLASLSQSLNNPGNIAWRTFSYLLYGQDHAYGTSLEGRAETIESFTREDMVAFHESWIRPDNATITVVGDTSLAGITALLEEALGDWQPPARPMGTKSVEPLEITSGPRVILVDKPGAVQSTILAGHLMPDGMDEVDFDVDAINDVLGGSFTSRLNMNLREDKGWAYGAGSSVSSARGPQAFTAQASVQTDKTAEAMAEIYKEIVNLGKGSPPTDEEIDLIVKGRTLALPGQFERNSSLMSYLNDMDRFDYPYDYILTLPDDYHALTSSGLAETARTYLHPDRLTWVVVGDLSEIESKVRQQDLGDVEVWDAEGNRLR